MMFMGIHFSGSRFFVGVVVFFCLFLLWVRLDLWSLCWVCVSWCKWHSPQSYTECILLGMVLYIAQWLQSELFAAYLHWFSILLSIWFAAKSDLPVLQDNSDCLFNEIIGLGFYCRLCGGAMQQRNPAVLQPHGRSMLHHRCKIPKNHQRHLALVWENR